MGNFRLIILLTVMMFVMISCGRQSGDTIINIPDPIEDKDKIFRGGFGLITIRYTPPPPPIFELNNYVDAIEFDKIKTTIGIPDKPVVIEYTIDLAVYGPIISQKSGNAKFDSYILEVIRGWGYTRYGRGLLKVAIDVPKRKVIVDPSYIRLSESEPGKPAPSVGQSRNLVKAFGFTIIEGRI